MNTSSKVCNFSMKERSNEGMMQGMYTKKVTFFVSLKKGLYVVSDCIGKMTAYMLKRNVYKRCMKTDRYPVKNVLYINSDGMKITTVYMLHPTVCNCCLYTTTNELNIWIQASIEMLYRMNICIEASNEMLFGKNIWIQTMNIYKSYIDNYNQITN